MTVIGIAVGWLLILGCFDWRKKAVPTGLLLAGAAAAAAVTIYRLIAGDMPWQAYLIGTAASVLPGVLLLITAFATGKAGEADGIVFFILGAVLDARTCFFLFGVSLFLTALFSVGILLLRKGGKNKKIPYLPFVAAACLLKLII